MNEMTNNKGFSIVEQAPDSDKEILKQMIHVGKQRRSGNHDNTLPIVDVKIPDSVLMACPKTNPHHRQAKNCIKCECFHGIVQKAWSDDDPLPWASKYAIDRKSVV